MNDTSTYNGWTNRETWLVSLWLNNDPGSYEMLAEALARSESDFKKLSGLSQR